MCGIFGFSRYNENARRMAPVLAWELQTRGRDAWGATNGEEVIRRSGPQVAPYEEMPEAWWDGPVVFHNRGASFRDNAADPLCAHPFTFYKEDGSSVIGVHNGVVRNHADLNKEYKRDFKVDSMHIFAHRAEGRSWKDFYGWGNLVWWETVDGYRNMHFCRINDQDLHAATLKDGGLVICSQKEVLCAVARMFNNDVDTLWKLEGGQHYNLITTEDGKDKPGDLKEVLAFGAVSPVVCMGPTTGGSSYTTSGVTSIDQNLYCRLCFRNRVKDKEKALLCDDCFDKEMRVWMRKQTDGDDTEDMLFSAQQSGIRREPWVQ